jgi:hypothetical protein
MESIVETKASSILQFIHGLGGELHGTWEEGTWAAWLYDLLKPHVHQLLVCDPRRNALLKEGNKSDKIDARKLADLLRTGMRRPAIDECARALVWPANGAAREGGRNCDREKYCFDLQSHAMLTGIFRSAEHKLVKQPQT